MSSSGPRAWLPVSTFASEWREKLAAAAWNSGRAGAGIAHLPNSSADFRGCAFINAAAEAPAGSAGEHATKDFRTWLHGLFAALVTEAGYPDAGKLTAQLVILYDGANISAQLDHNSAAAAAARDAAAGLLNTAAGQVQGPTGTATAPHRS